MSIITENFENESILLKRIKAFFKNHHVGQLLKKSNAYKHRGIQVVHVLVFLVQLVFTKKSMYMNILTGTHRAGFAQDVVYRLLNSPLINWSLFVLGLAKSVIDTIDPLTSVDRLSAICADDSLFERPRSKKVELLSRVHDHAEKGKQKYKRGFRMLTVGWTDGASFVPLLFRHLSSQKAEHRYNEANPTIDKRSAGYKARQEAMSGAPEVLLSMLKQIKAMAIPAKHVLFDSWFSFPATMMAIEKIGFFVVGRLKKAKNIKYLFNGERKTLTEIYSMSKKRPGRSKYLLSVCVLLYNSEGQTLPARIVFVRDRSNRKKWIAFCSTDMALSEEDVIKLYGKRWDIEVFFKICKSYLKLAKEFQCLSYDSITAHTAVIMVRYMMLAVDKRQKDDPRSLGELFFLCYDEIADHSFADSMALILSCLHEALSECLFLGDSVIRQIVDSFVDKISTCFKGVLLPNPASS